MQTVEMRNSVISSVKRAFLGVTSRPRRVAIRWNEKKITILCYFDRFISEEDREEMSCVETEVMADFPEFEIRLFPLRRNVSRQMKSLDTWGYRRSKNMPRKGRYHSRIRRK